MRVLGLQGLNLVQVKEHCADKHRQTNYCIIKKKQKIKKNKKTKSVKHLQLHCLMCDQNIKYQFIFVFLLLLYKREIVFVIP